MDVEGTNESVLSNLPLATVHGNGLGWALPDSSLQTAQANSRSSWDHPPLSLDLAAMSRRTEATLKHPP